MSNFIAITSIIVFYLTVFFFILSIHILNKQKALSNSKKPYQRINDFEVKGRIAADKCFEKSMG